MPGDEQERFDALPPGMALRDYTIEGMLGHGGFGIVYRARHNELGNRVAIKEYLPVELALREGLSVHPRSAACRAGYEDGLRRFRDEARTLVEFQSHPSIVSCREFFRANGTAYLVMEHEEGLPLSGLLRRREAAGRPFAEADLLAVMVPLLEGLARVHEAGALHRDIKPSNILVRRADERPVLIDFGAAKQAAAERSKSMAPYTEGYAALEQVGEGKLGSWTDVYAAGAVMWRMVAGGNPPWQPPNPVKVEKRANAVVRGAADPLPSARELGAGRFSAGVLEAIDRCLQLNEQERIRGCGELLGLLRGAGAVEKAAVAAPQARGGRRPRRMLTAAGVVLAAALAWLALASWNGPTPVSREAEAGAAGGSMQDAALARAEAQWNAVRDTRDAEAARAYIEEYGGVEGAGVWVKLAESLLAEMDRERRVREATENERKAREAERSRPGRRFRDCAGCPQMVVIPAGSFEMGSPESDEDGYDDERPAHRVEIGEAFAVGVYEVTFEEWDACVAAGGCAGYRPADQGWGRGGRPVINVSWEDAQAYVEWLSRKTGKQYRLLSEAEWEYAARGGSGTRYWWGDEIGSGRANCAGCGSRWDDKQTAPVRSFRANGYGLYDMHGNVWEWVQDCWHGGSYREAPTDGDAWKSGNCSRRVMRGGSWLSYPRGLRSAIRSWSVTGDRDNFLGFRVARTLAP